MKRNSRSRADVASLTKRAARLLEKEDLDGAEKLCQQILGRAPNAAASNYLAGRICIKRGRLREAENFLGLAINKNQNHPDYWHKLGFALLGQGNLKQALAAYNRTVELNPNIADAHFERGYILKSLRNFRGALESFEQVIRLNPQRFDSHIFRVELLTNLQRLVEAVEACDEIIELNPDAAEAHIRRSRLYRMLGLLEEAETSARKALGLQPDNPAIHSEFLFLLCARAKLEPDRMIEELREWDFRHGAEGRSKPYSFETRNRDPQRRLKIGYVSSDFRNDVVSFFIEPLIASHDRNRFEVYCYAVLHEHQADVTTQRLKKLAEHWRFVGNSSGKELAEKINSDGIDILVDLGGHTNPRILTAFSYRPAPIQLTYLGFFASTGLSAMDYWLTDNVLHPPDTIEKSVETIYRLNRCWTCYLPEPEAPEVAARPDVGEAVVFGSFNHLSKLTPEVVEVWSRILQLLPASKLLVMDARLGDERVRQIFGNRFAEHGIALDRLLLKPAQPIGEYLKVYSEVDIVLDSFPRTGGTTTAEALWMGVPVVTLAGQRCVERISASKLSAVGLETLVTDSTEAYIDKALSLAGNYPLRQKMRNELREQMAGSQLCDAEGLAREVERAYQKMWERWLETKEVNEPIN